MTFCSRNLSMTLQRLKFRRLEISNNIRLKGKANLAYYFDLFNIVTNEQ